ncbi:50S ribosomal protein L11 methyltransferase [candidate division KSB1 bacterium]|nr:50S ribosomal protein L11 methyltransferase [candidate division KSB1 bacterium]
MANIPGDVILSFDQKFLRLLKPRGFLLLSGILVENHFEVKKRLGMMGLEVLKSRILEEFSTLLFQAENPS